MRQAARESGKRGSIVMWWNQVTVRSQGGSQQQWGQEMWLPYLLSSCTGISWSLCFSWLTLSGEHVPGDWPHLHRISHLTSILAPSQGFQKHGEGLTHSAGQCRAYVQPWACLTPEPLFPSCHHHGSSTEGLPSVLTSSPFTPLGFLAGTGILWLCVEIVASLVIFTACCCC